MMAITVMVDAQVQGPCYHASSFTSAPAAPLPDINNPSQIEIIHPTCGNNNGKIIYKYPKNFQRNDIFISEAKKDLDEVFFFFMYQENVPSRSKRPEVLLL